MKWQETKKLNKQSGRIWVYICILGAVGLLVYFYFYTESSSATTYVATTSPKGAVGEAIIPTPTVPEKPVVVVTHVDTPTPVKGVYMTSCVAGLSKWRTTMADLIDRTELNTVVIDIKDYSGTISIPTIDPLLAQGGGTKCTIKDIQTFITELHDRHIYTIGRITVFQDPIYGKAHPEFAVKRKDNGEVWKDHKGLAFIDVGATEYWKYISLLAKESYALGFDEINFDYIRFPSDGDMKNALYTLSVDKDPTTPTTKPAELAKFFSFIHDEMSAAHIPTSADLFGMTTTNKDDLNIGQVLESGLKYFDYVSPMVYPSHYPTNWHNYKNPADHPYDVVYFSMQKAVERAKASGIDPLKLRPWLQDFDLGAKYTPEMVRAQMKATYDAELTSWLLWDAANTYTESALLSNSKEDDREGDKPKVESGATIETTEIPSSTVSQ